MGIEAFNNSDYEVLISDLISDIYYSKISISSKIVLLRKLTELISRRFLNLGVGETMMLGDITTPDKNPKFKTTERLNNVDKALKKDFEKTIDKLREIGNKHSHTQNHIIATEEEWAEAEDLIWDMFSYLFVQYFLKFNLNLKSDKNVLSMFSFLPPEIRFRTLKMLIDLKGFDNVQLLDKYLLSIVKSRGWEEANSWLLTHRNEIQSMPYPSEAEIIEYIADFEEDELPLPLRKFQNVFDLLSFKIKKTKVRLASFGIYKNFEEASKYYAQYNPEQFLFSTKEQVDFKELIYFCFIGRIPTK